MKAPLKAAMALVVTLTAVPLFSACSGQSPSADVATTPSSVSPSPAAPGPMQEKKKKKRYTAHADYALYYNNMADIARLPQEVLIGRVESESRREANDVGDVKYQTRVLQIKVERVIKGSPPATVTVETIGYAIVQGEERQYEDVEGVSLEVGDRALFTLNSSRVDSARGVSSAQGVFILRNGEVADTPRRDPVVRLVEALSEAELIAQLEAAAGRR